MSVVPSLLAAEVTLAPPRTILRGLILGLETLLSRPGLHDRPIHAEVLIRGEATAPRFGHELLQEQPGHISRQQTLPVLRERGGVPDTIVHPQAHEPSKQEVVFQLLHQQPLAADAIEVLKQRSPEQPPR